MEKQMRFQLLVRYCVRAAEIAAKDGMIEEVTRVHSDMLAPLSNEFCQSHDAVGMAESLVAVKRLQSSQALVELEPAYRAARWVVLAFVPGAKLPDTLKVQRTDTDIRIATTSLVSIIESYAGQAWADGLMTGRFGTHVKKVTTAQNELLAATDALAAARRRRTEAYGPAYQGYLIFKHLVRDALGRSSPEYRRLHPRTSVSKQIDPAEIEHADDAAPDSAVTPADNDAPALAGRSPIKAA